MLVRKSLISMLVGLLIAMFVRKRLIVMHAETVREPIMMTLPGMMLRSIVSKLKVVLPMAANTWQR